MRTPALAALLLATACGRPLLFAEVEIPSAVVTVPQQVFPEITLAAPCSSGGTDPLNLCSQTVIEYDLGQDFRDLIEDASTVDLRLKELAIELNALDPVSNPLADFDNVARVIITAEGRDAATPPVELARYERVTGAPSARTITVSTRSTVNLGAYVRSGFIAIRAELEVDPPGMGPFTADVTGDFYLKVTLDWGKKAGLF